MSDESRLSIDIESRNAKQQAEDLAQALEVLDAAGVRVTAAAAKAGKAAGDAGSNFGKAGKEARSSATNVDHLNKSLKQTDAVSLPSVMAGHMVSNYIVLGR